MTDHLNPDHEPHHTESSTASLLTELQLYGHRPFQDEPDARPLPEKSTITTALADIFDALVATLTDTRLEPDLEDLLWSTVNLFHRAADRVERELDSNEQAQRRSQKDQDGSEIRSVELERLLAEGLHWSSDATPSRSCATRPPTCSRRTPEPAGVRAAGRR